MTLTNILKIAAREKGLLTVNDTAELGGITPWWVRQLINRGELRAINVGAQGKAARWRVDPEDLHAWLASRENRPRDLTSSSRGAGSE